jgi:tetratricopeptide (TPR) repeat protein
MLDTDWSQIEAGQSWASIHCDDAEASALCGAYIDAGASILMHRLRPIDVEKWVAPALEAATRFQYDSAKPRLLFILATARFRRADLSGAIETFNASLALARQNDDREIEVAALTGLGHAHGARGDRNDAIAYYVEVLEATKPTEPAAILSSLAPLFRDVGKLEQAMEYAERALKAHHEKSDRYGEASALIEMGITSRHQMRPSDAMEHLKNALEMYRDIGDRHGEAVALANLGTVYDSIQEVALAIDCYDRAAAIAEQHDDLLGFATILANSLGSFEKMGDPARAVSCFIRARDAFRRVGAQVQEAQLHLNMSQISLRRGDHATVIEEAQQALHLVDALHHNTSTEEENPAVEWIRMEALAALEAVGEPSAGTIGKTILAKRGNQMLDDLEKQILAFGRTTCGKCGLPFLINNTPGVDLSPLQCAECQKMFCLNCLREAGEACPACGRSRAGKAAVSEKRDWWRFWRRT